MAICRNVRECVCRKHVSERLKKYLPILRQLCGADPSSLKEIIGKSSPCLVRLISELGLNILKGTVKLPKRQYKKLKPYKRLLISLSKPGFSADKHRQILLKKKGGFLPAILPYILTALSGFAGQALAKTFL